MPRSIPAFAILRVGVGLTSIASFALVALVVFARDAASTAREGAQVLGYVAKLFATAFTEGSAPTTAPWRIGAWQITIGLFSLAMFASVFTPGSRWFLHTVAVVATVVMLGYARTVFTGLTMEIVCLPFLAAWFLYYSACLFRNASSGASQ
ncbi:MAG: hypothetical protein ABI672_11320 [Vicinamibacteria bacterium]